LENVFALVYIGSLMALFGYGMNCYFLLILHRLRAPQAPERVRAEQEHIALNQLPAPPPPVTIQLPMFNERYVAERLIEAASVRTRP